MQPLPRSPLRLLLPAVLVLTAALVFGPGLGALGQDKPIPQVPEPDKTAQGKAEALILNLFRAKFQEAKKDPAAAVILAGLLLKEAKTTNDDPALRFVALAQARDLAAQGGDIELGLEAVAELSKFYVVDALAMKSSVLSGAADKVSTPEAALALIQAAFVCLDEAVAADHYKPAAAVVAAAEQAVLKIKDDRLPVAARIKNRAAEVEAARTEFDRLKPVVAKLEKEKDDPEANLEMGRYLCVLKGNFERGLPLLLKGKDADWKALATRDLANPTDVKQQVALGDDWDKLAGEQKTLPKRNLERRAYQWYQKALPQLTGLSKVRVEQRHDELAKQFVDEPSRLSLREMNNSIGMRLVRIPAGKFLMGAPNGEPNAQAQEQPVHEVEITQPFYMGAFEVTQAQYEKLMGNNPSMHKNVADVKDTSKFPVENVSWTEAKDFCDKLSALPDEQKAGRVYRLPTEAEWEYACRAGGKGATGFGDALASAQANFNGNNPYGGGAMGPHLNRPTNVGSYKPNAWGLYDMHGNVWEWCEDWFDGTYYARSPKTDPKGPDNGTARVHHGGSYMSQGYECRAAYRISNAPNSKFLDAGFRVVCVIGKK